MLWANEDYLFNAELSPGRYLARRLPTRAEIPGDEGNLEAMRRKDESSLLQRREWPCDVL